MASIAESTALCLVVFASAETFLLNFFRIILIAFKNKLEWLEFSALMRSVTEWLVLGFSACAIIVGLALLKVNLERLVLGDIRLSTVARKLVTVSDTSIIFFFVWHDLFSNLLLLKHLSRGF